MCFRNSLLAVAGTAAFLLLGSCGGGKITVTGELHEAVTVEPDYKDVTVPPNIAPLNFMARLEGAEAETCVIIEGSRSETSLQVRARAGKAFDIPQGAWRRLLEENRGADILLTVCRKEADGWKAYDPFPVHVAEEEADGYIAYRLLMSCFGQWNRMGIYQRDISTFDQSVIYENSLTDYNCVNCHSFADRDPGRMLFHMRAKSPGTLLLRGDRMEKLNTGTPETLSALVYPYWHPGGRYVTASVNLTHQSFFYHHDNTLEVYDSDSDVVIYDTERHEIFSSPLLKQEGVFETFPMFSPDGRSLYYLTAAAKQLPVEYRELKYSLCRVDFDPETRSLGEVADTVLRATDFVLDPSTGAVAYKGAVIHPGFGFAASNTETGAATSDGQGPGTDGATVPDRGTPSDTNPALAVYSGAASNTAAVDGTGKSPNNKKDMGIMGSSGMSVSFPRISPDGQYLVFVLQEFGNFSAWHGDADLYALRLSDATVYPLTEANSDASESYHSWSSNSRWMVFSSRRIDGLYTRPYFAYVDKDGRAHKPFLLPQKDPVNYYEDMMEAYNLPEFIHGKVEVNPHDIATLMKDDKGIDVQYYSGE